MLKTSALAFTLILSTSALASVCPGPSSAPALSPEEARDFLTKNRIKAVSSISPRHLQNFYAEFMLFPESLQEEMLAMEADIHILEGTGVTEDPSWDKTHTVAAGRSWSHTPGSGGFPYLRQVQKKHIGSLERYNQILLKNCERTPGCNRSTLPLEEIPNLNYVPTRIVVNQLYNYTNPVGGHGSVNLYLHEHAHSLDSLYADHDISSSPAFKNLFKNEENVRYLRKACSSHCGTGTNVAPIEAFAELFATYHACQSARETMEAEAPEIANFFADLVSVKEFKIKENRKQGLDLIPEEKKSSTPVRRPRRGLLKVLGDIFNR